MDAQALLAEGAAAYGRGDIAGALARFEQVAAAGGELRLAALINAASMRDELGDYPAAVRTYRSVLSELPDDAIKMRSAALINVSQSLQHVGDLDAAADALETARTILLGTDEHREHYVACLFSLTAVAIHRGQWARAGEIAAESLGAARQFAPAMAGHPLMNLAAVNFETGRTELALDFAAQALTAFEQTDDRNAVADTQQNLALMRLRADRADGVAELLHASQAYYEMSGNSHRFGVGLKAAALYAEQNGDLDGADRRYRQALRHFRDSGALLDVAAVCTCLATLEFGAGRVDEGEALLAEAFGIYRDAGLGLQCAQVDFWHAGLLESVSAKAALDLAIPAALAIDAARCMFTNGHQRAQWNAQVAAPSIRLAFRLARAAAPQLLPELVETYCAGVAFDPDAAGARPPRFEPMTAPTVLPDTSSTLALGAALAAVAAEAGLPVAPPPPITLPDGRIALAPYLERGLTRYHQPVRGAQAVPSC